MTVSYKLCALLVFSITAYSHLESPFCVAHCGASPQVLDSDTGEIRSSSYNTWTYRFGSVCDCWVIKGSENEPIVLRFSRFFVKCDKEWVSLKSSADDEPVVLCGKTLPEPLKFPGGNITVVHHFLPHQYPVSKFILSYFRESENCPKTSFQCPRGQCIPLFLRCNGRIDCPDDDSGADEQGCDDDMDYLEVQTVANKDSERQMVTEKTQSLVRTTPGYGYDDFWQSERAQLGQEQPQTKAETLVSTTPVEWPCGGLFQTFYGTFSSPAPRGNRLFCVWSLDPQDSRPLRLDLQQLVLGPVDRLTVYNRGEGKGDVIKNITNTSNYKSVQVESHTGLMSLVYETFPGSEAGGFKATFHVGSYCPPSEYRCGGSMGGCYTKEQRCDGKWDCPETGKDEEACRGCGTNQFACGMVGQKAVAPSHFAGRPVCYPATERCNYQLYCADLSDEKDCTVCQPGTFHCDSDRCVFESWRCDGQVDCKDGTDELNCTVMLPRKVITAATVGSLVCGLLLVIAMGCTCKLYSLRTREYSLFAPISRQEAQLIQQQAPPSYGQLIAQGVIPPVEDFPTENPNEVLMLMVVLVLEPPGSLMHKCIHDEVQAGVEVIRGERSLHEPKLAQEPRARRSTKQRGIVGNSFPQPITIKTWIPVESVRLSGTENRRLEAAVEEAVRTVSSILSVNRSMNPLLLSRDFSKYCKFVWKNSSSVNHNRCGKANSYYRNETCLDVTIPDNHLSGCEVYPEADSPHRTVLRPEGAGLPDVDFVLYLQIRATDKCRAEPVLAYAVRCQTDWNGRPVAGAVVVCRNRLTGQKYSHQTAVQTVIHELLHVLGFSKDLFNTWKDCSSHPVGNPCSPRGKVTHSDGSGQTRIYSPSVISAMQKHLLSSDPELGGPLENLEAAADGASSHWESRVLQGSIMGAVLGDSTTVRVDPITLAVFQDTGWYTVDLRRAQSLVWGDGEGKSFGSTKTCRDKSSSFFCTGSGLGCHFLHLHKGECQTDPYLDGCRIYKPMKNGSECWKQENSRWSTEYPFSGEMFGFDSRCFFSSLSREEDSVSSVVGRCYRHRCTGTNRYQIQVSGSGWVDCPAGGAVQIKGYQGSVFCPDKRICVYPDVFPPLKDDNIPSSSIKGDFLVRIASRSEVAIATSLSVFASLCLLAALLMLYRKIRTHSNRIRTVDPQEL